MKKTLRDYQRAAISATSAFFREGKKNPVIIAPCGAGKSLILSEMARLTIEKNPSARVLVLAHIQTLLQQNRVEFEGQAPELKEETGFYCAGLGEKDLSKKIVFASIQSLANAIYDLPPYSLVIVDEAHLIPRKESTQYQQVLTRIAEISPRCQIVGLSATPYRDDSGLLWEGEDAMFSGAAYEIEVQKLIDEGYLVPIYSKNGKKNADLSKVRKRGGEYQKGDLGKAFNEVAEGAIEEVLENHSPSEGWLVFCANIQEAEHATKLLQKHGLRAACVTSKHIKDKEQLDEVLNAFENSELDALVSVNMLSIGVNLKRARVGLFLTAFTVLNKYVQAIGRLSRTFPGKTHSTLFDYGGNVERFGPVDSLPEIRRRAKKKDALPGEAPTRECPECKTLVFIGKKACEKCGLVFPLKGNGPLSEEASEGAILKSQLKPWKEEVLFAEGAIHKKKGKPDSLRIDYYGPEKAHEKWLEFISPVASEWLCFGHKGYARAKAREAWEARYKGAKVPENAQEALDLFSLLPDPVEIVVKQDPDNRKFVRVKKVLFSKDLHHD